MEENEIWKPFNDLYEASNIGRIRRLDCYVNSKNGSKKFCKCHILKTPIANTGYCFFNVSINGKEIPKNVHIAVWEAFNGPIPKGYNVHHINHIRTDNRLENLELIESSKHSRNHLNEHKEEFIKASIKTHSKPILQYTIEGEFVAEYPSIAEAARQNGFSNGYISDCLLGNYKTAYNFVWKYKNVA